MWLAEIWRYPVKSMAGERLTSCALTPDGVPGDRIVHVEDARGRFMTARTHPRLLGLHATLSPDGDPLVDGLSWRDPRIAARVTEAAGPGAHLVYSETPDRFDILPLLVATDGALAAFARDPRRLRPNLIIAGVPALTERTWEGHRLAIGDAILQFATLRARCVMTTYDPDTLIQDPTVLQDIRTRFSGRLALDTQVVHAAPLHLNAPVRLLD